MRYSYLLGFILILTACSGDEPEEKAADSLQSTGTSDFAMPSTFTRYSVTDFFSSTTIFGSSVNYDGSAVLITTDETGIYNTYRQPLDGSERQALTQSESNATLGVSFFPADDRILFTADQEGNELNHLYVRELDDSTNDLTPGKSLKARFIGWTSDNGSFFVKTNERDSRYFDLYKYNTSNYSRELIFENNDAWTLSVVSDDGHWLALRKTISQFDSNIYLMNLQDEKSVPVLTTAHMGAANYIPYAFTPDGQYLVYGTDANSDFIQAWRHHLINKQRQKIAGNDWDVVDVSYSKDGRYQVIMSNVDAGNEFEIRDTLSGERLNLPNLPEGDMRGVGFSPDSKKLIFYINADTSPSNLFVYTLDGEKPLQLTQALSRKIEPSNLVKSTRVRFESEGEVDIPALLYRPYTATEHKPASALIWIHGGPGGQSRKGYKPAIQHLVNQGYAILAVNNRGSSGYGKVFYHLDDRKHGEADLQDIVYAKRFLQTFGWIDREKIGVMGGSYGGYLTMAAMAFTDEFGVGIDIFGVTNWERTLKSIPPWWEDKKKSLYGEMGDPAEDNERHRRISPLFHANDIKKPVLIVQGANDPRVLQAESDEMVAAIRANGVPVEYVLFNDEGHGFRKKVNRIKAQTAYLTFLERHL